MIPSQQTYLNNEVIRIVSCGKPVSIGKPIAALIMGGVAAGKTTFRKKNYSTGYVLIDAADIFLNLSSEPDLDFPDALLEPMEFVGSAVALKALSDKRPIVTEIIGADLTMTRELIAALKSIGYDVHIDAITCDIEKAFTRNMSRGPDNISAFYTETFHINWIISACQLIELK